jgi:beta-glucuronidase
LTKREFLFRAAGIFIASAIASNGASGQTRPASDPAPGGREIVQISANWRFQLDVTDQGEKEQWYGKDYGRSRWARAIVPKAWDLFDEALWGYEGIGWYATTLAATPARKDKVQRLKFGRVNYHSKVWLNGEWLGENVNGWLPFEFDISGKLKPDKPNLIVLRVDNRPRLTWLPGAKQIEWIQYGGILEPVTLETSPKTYISDLAINAVPDGAGASVSCLIEITSREEQEKEVTLRVAVAGDPMPRAPLRVKIAPGTTSVQQVSISLAKANRWSPDTPFLYRLTTTLESGRPMDRVTDRFGVRRLETRGREILLNGQRFGARGVNRYDEYGKFGPRPPRELLIQDLRRMKSAGVNFVRVHYPQSPDIISLYDEMGFVMSEEVPLNWWGNNFSGKGDEVQSESILDQAMPALERMIRRDKNHPAVIVWSMANESQTANEAGIRVMRTLIRRARELDKSRLVTFVISPEESKAHRAYEDADLVAVNVYQGSLSGKPAAHASQFEELVSKPSEEYIRRQLAAWPDKPVLITEFGARGVPGIHGDVPYSEDFQAGLIQAAWRAIRNCDEASGGVLWSWADYYHRRTFIHYAVFGPYGAVTVDRKPKAALAALAKMYGGKVSEPATAKQP